MNPDHCRRFLTQVHPLASGDVEGARALALSFHAARCAGCEARLASARRVVALLETSARQPLEPPAPLVANIMSALPPDPRVVRRRRHAWGLGVAAAGLGAVLGLAAVLILSVGSGPAIGAPLAGLRSVLATVASYLQQVGALFTALADILPRLSPGADHAGSGGGQLPGLVLVSAGLLGALTATYMTAVRGLAGLRRS